MKLRTNSTGMVAQLSRAAPVVAPRAALLRSLLIVTAASLGACAGQRDVPSASEATAAEAGTSTAPSGDDAAPMEGGLTQQDSGTQGQDGGKPKFDAGPMPAGSYIQGTLMVGTSAVNLDPPAISSRAGRRTIAVATRYRWDG
jgi:hypothetical protein